MSCLIAKLSHYVDLSDDDCRLLAALEADEQEYSADQLVHSANEEIEFLYVVKKGWLYNYIDLPDGRRQIVRIHHPGDVLGLGDIAYLKAGTSLRACEDVVLCPFPKTHLDAIFVNAPRLTALLFTIAVRDQAILVDMLKSVSRMSARERMAFLLLDLISRLRVTNSDMTTQFRCPLSLTELGDTLALTGVYVKKTIEALEQDHLLRYEEGIIELLDEPALEKICDFSERYSTIDTSWFPGG